MSKRNAREQWLALANSNPGVYDQSSLYVLIVLQPPRPYCGYTKNPTIAFKVERFSARGRMPLENFMRYSKQNYAEGGRQL